jgi:hypothetical protein
MGQLVNDLLNFGWIGHHEVQLQVTGLNSIVKEVVDELRDECKGRKVEWKIGNPALCRMRSWIDEAGLAEPACQRGQVQPASARQSSKSGRRIRTEYRVEALRQALRGVSAPASPGRLRRNRRRPADRPADCSDAWRTHLGGSRTGQRRNFLFHARNFREHGT